LLCRVPFTTSGSEIHASLEYVMKPKSAGEGGGQGLCIYLVDPSVEGWDRAFDGSGPLGFVGKAGAIVGVGIDCTGQFCEGKPASIAIKRASDSKLLCDPVPLEGGVVTRPDELWRKVKVKFDIEDNTCDVTIGGVKVLDDIKFEGVKIPKKVCIAVCAGTADGKTNMMCVNKLKLKSEDEDEGGGKMKMKFSAGSIKGETGVPKGCTDYGVVGGKLKPLDEEGDWRMAGTGKVGFGFELTQDKDDQEGHLLCRVPFEAKGAELHASLEYVMKPKSAAEGGGQGLCIYLVDPAVEGWDRMFDGSGPLGFVGKAGAIVGVGIDCTGEFCEGQPASIAIKRASDSKLLCDPVPLEGGVVTRDDELWRKVKIKFDIEENKCDVTIGGVKVLDDIPFEGVKIPKRVCIAVCAGTAGGHTNMMCVNKLKIKGE